MPKKKQEEEFLTYEPEELDNELAKEMKKLEKKPFKKLTDQIESEYQLAWWYMKPKFDEWALRLKLYNNQRRDKEAVGDPLLFTIHQTVLASLYEDKLMSTFGPRERGDVSVAENLTQLAEYDYEDMDLDVNDYDWDWDSAFFGRGLQLLMEFDREKKCPIPEIIDPMVFLRQPGAKSVAGDIKGRGALRFCGFEKRMTKFEMEQSKIYFNLDKLGTGDTDLRSLYDENHELRNSAQGHDTLTKYSLKGENKDFRILHWFTRWNGKLVYVGLANDRKSIVRFTELGDFTNIPIIDRAIYPMSHDWDGVSIPDIVEDKQRARAVIQNLGLKSAKISILPRYLFDNTRIKNKADLNAEFNKHISVDGRVDNAMSPVPTSPLKQEVNWIMEILDTAAQKATASPDFQQGSPSQERRTATEISTVANKVDVRYSLSARIFGWSEKRRWKQWYFLYKTYFEKDIDEKILRISGAMGYRWRTLTRENIIANTDPDIKIESRVLSEAKRREKMQSYQNFINMVFPFPDTNKLYALRTLGKFLGLTKDDVGIILPPTSDELEAEDENEALDNDKLVKVEPTDDDLIHMEIHNRGADTAAKYAHIQAHRRALKVKKMNPEVFPEKTGDSISKDILSKQSGSLIPNVTGQSAT
jgi:hypothetical protein